MYEDRRIYRNVHAKKGLFSFDVTVRETNLNIQAERDLTEQSLRSVLTHRSHIENYIQIRPEFASSLVPLKEQGAAPAIVTAMLGAAERAGVGPMAAVAGAMAEFTGRDLKRFSDQVVVENGGDVFVSSRDDMTFTIFAGSSPLSMKTGIKIPARKDTYGMCTSSGTFGHSKSFGRADAVCVLAQDCALADAAATALCNRVHSGKDIETVIEQGQAIEGVEGLIIIVGKSLGAWGNLSLVRL